MGRGPRRAYFRYGNKEERMKDEERRGEERHGDAAKKELMT
jgi:hypothetical protein